jgi:ribosomal protein S18 acetylase RimI-like enzyme
VTEIRAARDNELAAIADAHTAAHWETYEPLFGAAARRLEAGPVQLAFRRALRDGALVLVAEDAGEIVGVSHLAGATLHTIYLRASHRGAGLGRRMMTELLAAAAARGEAMVRFNVHSANAPAQGFYAALGANVVGRQWTRHPDGDWEDLVYEIATG